LKVAVQGPDFWPTHSTYSSVGRATGYGIDGRGSILGKGKRFLHNAKTGSEAHLFFFAMGTGGFFPGVRRPRCGDNHSPPPSTEVKLYLHCPIRLHGVMHNLLSAGTTLPISWYSRYYYNKKSDEITLIFSGKRQKDIHSKVSFQN
jgi:hypothetical protein